MLYKTILYCKCTISIRISNQSRINILYRPADEHWMRRTSETPAAHLEEKSVEAWIQLISCPLIKCQGQGVPEHLSNTWIGDIRNFNKFGNLSKQSLSLSLVLTLAFNWNVETNWWCPCMLMLFANTHLVGHNLYLYLYLYLYAFVFVWMNFC